ncbi:hypothetical protein [Bacillus horti]|uniref:Helicase XPB/Ssl2 N-terminal domain-containing protein n=1 Tax=Caldalkalibacillus horti TaxID=77523 RepID=A0ABT9VWW1_9BACI|nr:hypothetical protein [Bacillus horti]MDQ0165487.1 hypothetical protein [Bacillus horti]
MSLSEYLLYRDIQDLNKMANIYECECNRNSKLELVQAIHYQMLNRSFFLKYVQELDESFIAFSTYIIFQPTRMFTVEDLMAKGSYILALFSSEMNPRKWISQLMSSGWLFPITTKNHIQLEIPLDLSIFLRKEWGSYWLRLMPNQTKSLPFEAVRRKEEFVLVADLRLFLAKLSEEAFPMTVDGSIHKKPLHALLSLMSVQEVPLSDSKWRFGYGRRFPHYPNRFALIYDFCFHKGWIQEDGGQVYVSISGQQEVEDMSTKEILEDIRAYWLRVYRKPIPSLPFITTLILELCKDRWISDSDMFHALKKWLKQYYYDDVKAIFEQRIVQMLIHLGYVEVTIDPVKEQQYIKSCV